ncbi:MAG: PD40 domain-containing protein, partial [Phycisphaerales bacterium]
AQVLPLAPRDYHSLRISPNGTHIAFDIRDGDNSDIWIYDIAHKTLTPLTSDEHSHNPAWTADGKRIVFASLDKLFSQPADGSTQRQPLMELKDAKPASCSPDGKELLVRFDGSGLGSDIWVLSLENARDSQLVPFIERDNNQRNAVWSPDGLLVAYCSDELGSWEVYMEPYPGPGPKIRVSTDGGSQPVWSHNGKELYYRKDGKVVAVTVETEPEFRIGGSRQLFEGNYAGCRVCQSYDVMPDGRFLMIRDPQESTPLGINVVLNWFEELKRVVPPRKG